MMTSTGGAARRFSTRLLLAAIALGWSLSGAPSLAQEGLAPRLQIGSSILPGILAADKRLAGVGSETLPVYLVYRDNRRQAEQIRSGLEKIGSIRGRELRLESVSLGDLPSLDPPPASAVFIAEPLGAELEQLLEFSRQRKLLLFSPFEGDVERGVATGFRVTDKVLPMVNMQALKQSNVQLKAFFLRIAVKHE